jgi:hypothetical protein
MLRHALALLFPSGAESVQSLSRLGGGLLSKSSKIIQRPFLLQKAAARLSSTRIPSTSIPGKVRKRYVEQDLKFAQYSDNTNRIVREFVCEVARKMLVRGRPLEEIVEDCGLTEVEVEAIKTAASHEDRFKP